MIDIAASADAFNAMLKRYSAALNRFREQQVEERKRDTDAVDFVLIGDTPAAPLPSLASILADGIARGVNGDRLVPGPRGKPLAGRNDPCPCGSGKKFKKCCAT